MYKSYVPVHDIGIQTISANSTLVTKESGLFCLTTLFASFVDNHPPYPKGIAALRMNIVNAIKNQKALISSSF